MAAKKSSLGRGIDAVWYDNSVEDLSSGAGSVKVKLTDIEPNREQPRKQFDESALAELSESIARHGVLQPLLVRPTLDGTYQLVAGERRWRASRMAGLTEVPVVIKDLTDEQVAQLALVENLQREDLNPVEEAYGYKELSEKFNYTQEEIADIVGKSRAAVTNSLRLLSLPEDVCALLGEGKISAGHARAILTSPDPDFQKELAKLVVERDLSVRETERLARSRKDDGVRGKKQKRRNPYYDEVEIALSDVLQRNVRVTKSSKKGSIEIEFFDDDDLKKLLKIFDEE